MASIGLLSLNGTEHPKIEDTNMTTRKRVLLQLNDGRQLSRSMKNYISIGLMALLLVGCVNTQPQLPPLPLPPSHQTAELVGASTNPPPVILTRLTNMMALQGDTISFSVVASNTTYYRWQVPGRPVFVGTNTYTITNIQSSNRGVVAVYLSTNRSPVLSSAYISVGTTNILAECIPTGGQGVELTWCPSPDTNVVSYAVYYGSGQTTNWTPSVYDTNFPCGPIVREGTNWLRNYTNSVMMGNTNRTVIGGLQSGVAYYFAAKALDSGGNQSDFSDEAQYTTPLYAKLTNSFPVTLTYLDGNTVQFSAKVCPDSLITIQDRQDIRSPWSVMATNLTADRYGNFFYNHTADLSYRFFRLQLQ